MKNIDFLPDSYRRQRSQRRAHLWEIGVVLLFAGIVGATAATQVMLRWQVASQLAATEQRFQGAMQTLSRHRELESQLAAASQTADLYVYLEHPWPRTRIVTTVLDQLPAGVVLTRLHVAPEGTPTAAPLDAKEEEARAKLSPAQRDLERLRRDADRRHTVVWLIGATDDPASVYELAHRLEQTRPFASVKLESVERDLDDVARRTTFKLKCVLAPGYGQPGGPVPDAKPNSDLAKAVK
jgi:Tfp pilus assembly protein PilN